MNLVYWQRNMHYMAIYMFENFYNIFKLSLLPFIKRKNIVCQSAPTLLIQQEYVSSLIHLNAVYFLFLHASRCYITYIWIPPPATLCTYPHIFRVRTWAFESPQYMRVFFRDSNICRKHLSFPGKQTSSRE